MMQTYSIVDRNGQPVMLRAAFGTYLARGLYAAEANRLAARIPGARIVAEVA